MLITVVVMLIAFAVGSDEEPEPSNPLSGEQLYTIPYDICAADPAGTYAQAGTEDPEAAALWYSEGLTGAAAQYGYEGCLDALTGLPNRYSP